MIWTLTLNAVIDHVYQLPAHGDDAASLADVSWHVPAGKGVNVTRALASLGLTATAVVVADAISAALYREALTEIGAVPRLLVCRPSVRHHATVLYADGRHLHVRERGTPCDTTCLSATIEALDALAPGDQLALSGSLPPGLDIDTYARLVRTAQQRGARAWVDCSDAPLAEAIAALPFAVKVNASEASHLLGVDATTVDQAAAAVERLLAGGCQYACVTLGPDGLVLGSALGLLHACTPPRRAGSSVGSGDAALAGLIAASTWDAPAADAARLAAAAGAANAGGILPGAFSRASLDVAIAATVVRRLA